MSHFVSIIMPAYNAEKYIAESIRSVLDQTYANWELVVVDDGSTDKTAEIVRSFQRADDRIKYVFQQNGRLPKARNTGLENSTGGMVAFLDSDDLWMREKLELQVKVMEETGADLVFSNGFIFHGDDATDETEIFPLIYGRFEGTEMFNLLLIRNRIPVLSALARRDAINSAGLFNEELVYGCEDYDLWLRLAKGGAVFHGMEEKLVRYRRHPASMTHNESNQHKPEVAVVRKHIYESSLDEKEVKKRIRNLYRRLISALLEEGKIAEAKEYAKEFAAWDRLGMITAIQKFLIEIWPSKYNFISRECLYRTELHIGKILGRTNRAELL